MVDIKSNGEQRKAMKCSKKYDEQQKATMDIGAGKTKTCKKKPRRAAKGTKSPSGNQAVGPEEKQINENRNERRPLLLWVVLCCSFWFLGRVSISCLLLFAALRCSFLFFR